MEVFKIIHATAVLQTILKILNSFENWEDLDPSCYEFYRKIFKKLEKKYFLRNGELLEINEEAEKELKEIFQKTKEEVFKKLESLVSKV